MLDTSWIMFANLNGSNLNRIELLLDTLTGTCFAFRQTRKKKIRTMEKEEEERKKTIQVFCTMFVHVIILFFIGNNNIDRFRFGAVQCTLYCANTHVYTKYLQRFFFFISITNENKRWCMFCTKIKREKFVDLLNIIGMTNEKRTKYQNQEKKKANNMTV